MRLSRRQRGFLLTAVIMACGGARAAYPTPGGAADRMQVHPTPMLDPYAVVEAFSAAYPDDDFSVVADPRTRSVVTVGRPRLHAALAAFIRERTAEKMRRYVVHLEITKEVGGRPQVVGTPRLEVPHGERAQLNLDGDWGPGGPDWTSRLQVQPTTGQDGRIRLQLHSAGAPPDEDPIEPVEVELRPGQDLVIDREATEDPRLRQLADVLNRGRSGGQYTVKLQVRPL